MRAAWRLTTGESKARGARAAVRDADAEVSEYATAHYVELRAAHAETATAAAERVDAALRQLLNAYGERKRVDQAPAALGSLVAQPRMNLTPISRVERVAAEAESAAEPVEAF